MSGNSVSFDTKSFAQTFTHHTAFVNDVRLHYVIAGQGEPMVLLHGFPMTWYHWRRIMPALAERYTVIAPDTRGFGDSAKPATGYDAQTVADDIYKLVQQLGYDRIFLVGHDLGAHVAYAYAAMHREDVRRLVFMEADLRGSPMEFVGEQVPWHFRFHNVLDLPEMLVAGKEREYISWFFQNLSYNPAATTPETIDEYVRTYAAPGTMRAAFSRYRAFSTNSIQNQESLQRPLPMPTLAIAGDRGIGSRVIDVVKTAADDVRSVLIERCGHFIAEEQPEYLIEQLLTFFNEENE